MKYYAIKKGKKVGIFTSWDEVKNYVNGYDGALYKSFKTKKEAEDFLNKKNVLTFRERKWIEFCKLNPKKTKANGWKADIVPDWYLNNGLTDNSNQYKAYTDGSYMNNISENNSGWGFVIVKCDEIISEGCGKVPTSTRQIAGECEAIIMVLEYCKKANINNIWIYHDLMYVAQWAEGFAKTNTEVSKEYKKRYDLLRNNINVHFVHVKSHTGDKWNEYVDELAKKGLQM